MWSTHHRHHHTPDTTQLASTVSITRMYGLYRYGSYRSQGRYLVQTHTLHQKPQRCVLADARRSALISRPRELLPKAVMPAVLHIPAATHEEEVDARRRWSLCASIRAVGWHDLAVGTRAVQRLAKAEPPKRRLPPLAELAVVAAARALPYEVLRSPTSATLGTPASCSSSSKSASSNANRPSTSTPLEPGLRFTRMFGA